MGKIARKHKEQWFMPGQLCSLADDAVRIELSPRRVIDGKVVTPEAAFAAEKKAFMAGEPSPVLIDVHERFAPKAWKVYKRVKDESHKSGFRFMRVDTAATLDEAESIASSIANSMMEA